MSADREKNENVCFPVALCMQGIFRLTEAEENDRMIHKIADAQEKEEEHFYGKNKDDDTTC